MKQRRIVKVIQIVMSQQMLAHLKCIRIFRVFVFQSLWYVRTIFIKFLCTRISSDVLYLVACKGPRY
jgi:hypothetical protein